MDNLPRPTSPQELRDSLRMQQKLLNKLQNSNLDDQAKDILIALIKAVFR